MTATGLLLFSTVRSQFRSVNSVRISCVAGVSVTAGPGLFEGNCCDYRILLLICHHLLLSRD